MSWIDTVTKFFRRGAPGQVSALARGASGEATLPRVVPAMFGDPGMASAFQQLSTMLAVDQDLLTRYADYENMDDDSTLSAALDVYADSATIADAVHGRVLWATSKDKIVRDIINDLLDRRIRIEEDVWAALRTFCKYGDAYAEIVVNDRGVLGLNWLPPPTVRRLVDQRGDLVGFIQDASGAFSENIGTREDLERLRGAQDGTGPQTGAGSTMVFFRPWEVVHWRFRGKRMRGLYGTSLLDSVRWVWKRLLMMEDNTLVMKLMKAPARFAFYIDTGDMPPREAKAAVEDVRRRYKKRKIVDSSTGKLDFRFNPLENTEDFFVPTRGGKESSRVEVLTGPDYDETGVLSYFQKKLYAGLRIPPQYLGGTEITNRAALTQEDVAFARLIMRIQREFVKGLSQVVRVHLAALNIDPDSVHWDLQMSAASAIFEMQQIEVWNARAGLAAAIQPFFTAPWIMANIFHMSDEDALFASEAKQHEVETQAISQAGVQADIMQRYPELGPEGALALGAPPPPMGMGGGDQMPAEAVKRVEKALTEVQRSNDRVLQSIQQVGSGVGNIGKRLRGGK